MTRDAMPPLAIQPRLVGRSAELDVIRDFFSEDAASARALVFRGDAGTGKSALLAEAAAEAEAGGRLVLRATGVEAEARLPFAGLHQILLPVLDRLQGLDPLQRHALSDALAAVSVPPEIFIVALGTLNLLSDMATGGPVVVVVDDAQWLDGASLEVLSFVARRLEAEQVKLAVASRSGVNDDALELPAPREHVVRDLGEEAAAELVDARFPELAPRARERVLRLAAGNPLALLELPHAHAGAEREPGDDLPLTRRLERAFAGRARGLGPVTRWLLLVAALDEGLSLEEVLVATARLAGRLATLDDVAPAEAAHLVTADSAALRFRHPLVASAVRQAATTARRHAVHTAIAEALAAEPERSLWHRAACALGPAEALAIELEAAATNLRRRHGTAVAIGALRRSAELSSSPLRRGRRLVGAAELSLELGRDKEVVELLDTAEPLPLELKTRHSMLWLREALREASGTATLESTVAVAEQLIDEGDPRLALRALFTASTRCYMFRAPEGVRARIARVAEQCRLPKRDPRLAAIRALADPAVHAGAVVGALGGVTTEELIRTSRDPATASEALHLSALALTCVAEFGAGVGLQGAAIAGLRTQGRLGLLSRALGSHAVVGLVLADWQLATQAADECLRLTGYRPDAPSSLAGGEEVLNVGSALLVLGTVAANRGQHELGERLVDQSMLVHGGIGSNWCLAMIESARASLALAAGRSAEAFQHASRVYDSADAAHHWAVSRWATVVRDLADAALASGNASTAVALLEPLDRTGGSPEQRGTVAYADAVLAERDIDERFRRAFELAPASDYFQARLRLAYGSRLRRERRPAEARPQLRSAADGFEAIVAAPWAERARQELRASGETIRRRTPERLDELSPQEMQIARLVADGLTNREIGQRLFLSHRTIGSHLYRIFPKLGIASRAELHAALERRPVR